MAIKCINKLNEYIQLDNPNIIESVLDMKYLNKDIESIIGELKKYKYNQFDPKKVYKSSLNTRIIDFYVYSLENDERHYSFIVSINTENNAYSILPCGYITLDELFKKKKQISEEEMQNAYIDLNRYNDITYLNIE